MPVDPKTALVAKLKMIAELARDVLPELREQGDLVDEDGVDLVERSVSAFHYTPEDVENFDYFLHILARNVFGVDGEGWSPIQIIVVDKRRQDQFHIVPVASSRIASMASTPRDYMWVWSRPYPTSRVFLTPWRHAYEYCALHSASRTSSPRSTRRQRAARSARAVATLTRPEQ